MVWVPNLESEDFKSVGAPLLLEQNHTLWIRTGSDHWAKNANLTCHHLNHCNSKVWLQKKNSQTEKPVESLNHSLVFRQLWYWVPQWRYDLGTLMKCVCKVLIYHHDAPETQNFIMNWHGCSRPWMLWGSACQENENMNTQEWLILPPLVVGDLEIKNFIDANWRIRVI